jgi:hypothetical protein
VTPASGAIGAACEVPGMAQKIKAATAIAKMVRIIVFLPFSVTLARYRRLREAKVNRGRNASPGARGCRPQLRARRFLVLPSRERNARYIAAVRRSRSCVSHRVLASTIMQLAGQEVAMWGLWSVFFS